MTSTDLLHQDRLLRAEADALLADHSLLPLLQRFGSVHLAGSYALRLMTWRDLDINLAMSPLDLDAFFKLGISLAKVLTPRRAAFTDHLNFPATENIPGLYWGIHTNLLSADGWKIDLWGVTPQVAAAQRHRADELLATLTDKTRLEILSIKNVVCHDPRYRDSITSQDIYDAVLKRGVSTLEEFRADRR